MSSGLFMIVTHTTLRRKNDAPFVKNFFRWYIIMHNSLKDNRSRMRDRIVPCHLTLFSIVGMALIEIVSRLQRP